MKCYLKKKLEENDSLSLHVKPCVQSFEFSASWLTCLVVQRSALYPKVSLTQIFLNAKNVNYSTLPIMGFENT